MLPQSLGSRQGGPSKSCRISQGFCYGPAAMRTWAAGLCGLMAAACATSGAGESSDSNTVSIERALEIVDDFQKKYGFGERPSSPPPADLADVVAILRADEIHRYPEARQLADGARGAEALALRSFLELTWAGALRTVKNVLIEQRTVLATEKRQLELRTEPSARDKERLAQLDETIGAMTSVDDALNVLIPPHIEAGGQLAQEALREYPNHPDGHIANLMYARLIRNWALYGREDRYLEAEGIDRPGVEYVRAMAALERGNRPDECRQRLTALRTRAPEIIRTQAELVLVQDDIADTYGELEELRAVSPTHFLVRMAARFIEAEYETTEALRNL